MSRFAIDDFERSIRSDAPLDPPGWEDEEDEEDEDDGYAGEPDEPDYPDPDDEDQYDPLPHEGDDDGDD